MKLFLKIVGIIFLMVLSAAAALGVGGYFAAKKVDQMITTQLSAQISSANKINDKFSALSTGEQKAALESAIAKAQKAVDDTGLNLFSLIKSSEQLSIEVDRTINSAVITA